MTGHFGFCLCGTAKFEIQGDFENFYLCHCQYCQKDTGSAHAANLLSRSATLIWHSGEEAVAAFTLPGTRHSKSFCKLYGSALPSTQAAGLVVVPAGCLDTKTGSFRFNEEGAVWSDSWHQESPVSCLYVPTARGIFTITHEYGPPGGPKWGWRSSLSERPNGDFVLQMTNIAPWGEEGRAVRMVFSDAEAG